MRRRKMGAGLLAMLLAFLVSPVMAQNQNKVMGEVDFDGATKVEREAGVWIDGEYVGYLKELKGDKKVLLLPGDHEVTVRENGYLPYEQTIKVEPGATMLLHVQMQMAPNAIWPKVTATLKVNVHPSRAAVFVDNTFVGHAGELGGAVHSISISPGKHVVKVELPGYRTFETEVNLLAGQKSEVKTDLVKGSIDQAGALIKQTQN